MSIHEVEVIVRLRVILDLAVNTEAEEEAPPVAPALQVLSRANGNGKPVLPAGTMWCPECSGPFKNAAGLGIHRAKVHGVKSTNPETLARNRLRRKARAA